jgi:hypothetical protein
MHRPPDASTADRLLLCCPEQLSTMPPTTTYRHCIITYNPSQPDQPRQLLNTHAHACTHTLTMSAVVMPKERRSPCGTSSALNWNSRNAMRAKPAMSAARWATPFSCSARSSMSRLHGDFLSQGGRGCVCWGGGGRGAVWHARGLHGLRGGGVSWTKLTSVHGCGCVG